MAQLDPLAAERERYRLKKEGAAPVVAGGGGSDPLAAERARYLAKKPPITAQPAAAPRSYTDTAKDVGIGAAKGLGNTVTFGGLPAVIAPLLEHITSQDFHRPEIPMGPEAVGDPYKFLEATNTPQMAGKGLEFLAELLGPGLLKSASARKLLTVPEPEVSRYLANKSGVAETAVKNVSKVPYAATTGATAAEDVFQKELTRSNKFFGIEDLPGSKVTVAEDAVERRIPGSTGTSLERRVTDTRFGELLGKFGGKGAETVEATVAPAVEAVAKTEVGPGIPVQFYKLVGPEVAGADALSARLIDEGKYEEAATAIERSLGRFFGTLPKGESGAASLKALMSVAGGTAGAAAGATQGDTTTEKVENAVMGGAVGAFAPAFIGHALAVGFPKAAQKYVYTSVLSSPTSVSKAYLGAVGGAISSATERLASGDKTGALILKRLFSPEATKVFRKALTNPATTYGATMGTETPGFLGKVYGAGDAVARWAMEAGNVSQADAARMTLSGMPTTELGKLVLGTWNKSFLLRLGSSLFPRVGIQIIERGLERTPMGLAKESLRSDAGTKSIQAARALMGPAAGLLAFENSDKVPGWAQPFVTALAGPYALLVGGGLAAGNAADRGGDALAQTGAAIQQFAANTPFPAYGPGEAMDPGSIAAMAIPNASRDIARLVDPEHDRVTAGQPFGRFRAKIPRVREGLPVRGPAVNAAGKPTERTGLVAKLTAARPERNAPMKDIPAGLAAELKRLDVALSSPDYLRKVKLGQEELEVPAKDAQTYQEESRKLLIPRLEKVMASTGYRRSDDKRKKLLLERARDAADRVGAGAARAKLKRLLKERSRG